MFLVACTHRPRNRFVVVHGWRFKVYCLCQLLANPNLLVPVVDVCF